MGDEEIMNMLGAGNLIISVGDKVVGLANNNKSEQFTIAEDDIILKDQLEPWCMPDIRQSWDISCDAMIEPHDGIKDFIGGFIPDKFDVIIGQEVGKLPRKMKKAIHSKRMSKWKHKVASYINRHQIHIHDAEMVIRHETLTTTFSVAAE
jgi:hypothetical protein